MKILLTGHSGYFSKEFLKSCIKKKKLKIFCLTRKNKINKKNISFFKVDLSKNKIKNLDIIEEVDYIIHCAFIKMNSKISKTRLIQNNINITNNLIKILKNIKFKQLINFSTISLYPYKDGTFSEKAKINFSKNPDYPYAYSKYFAERQFNKKINKKKLLHLRIANIIFNKNDMGILWNMKRSIKNNNKIIIYGNGRRILNLVHVNKLILYIFKVLKFKNLYGKYNLSDYTISLKDIAKIIKKKYGNSKTKIIYSNIINSNPKSIINANLFFKKLNIDKPKITKLSYEI